jgi:hypothetical protein
VVEGLEELALADVGVFNSVVERCLHAESSIRFVERSQIWRASKSSYSRPQ